MQRSAGEATRAFALPRRAPRPRAAAPPRALARRALHTCVLCEDGRLLTFGWGSAGALGHGTTAYVLQAAPVDALHGHAVIVRRRLLAPLCLPRSQELP